MRTVIHPNEINEVVNCNMSVKDNIKVGMGATMYVGSDRYAMVITEVITPKKIKVAHVKDSHETMFVTDDNGVMMMPEHIVQLYHCYNDQDEYGNYVNYHHSKTYTLRKNGRWMPEHANMWDTGSIHIGEAENYRDPNF